MKVRIEWYEEVSYSSDIEVDDNELSDWLQGKEATPALVAEFLRSSEDDSEWFDQCDANQDCVSVDERYLSGVRFT